MYLRKLLTRLPILLLFSYQFYDMIYDYSQYHFTIELSLESSSRILPSITICIEDKYKIVTKDEILTGKAIVCLYNTENFYSFCLEKYVYLRYKHKEICLTFFNNETNTYWSLLGIDFSVSIWSQYHRQQKIIFHQPGTLSHFEMNNIFLSKYYQLFHFYIRKVTQNLLPKPFSTDCHDYSRNEEPSSSLLSSTTPSSLPRSQLECMFEYMKIEELNKCGKNIYWNNQVTDYGNLIFNFRNNTNESCKIKMNYKLLSKICQSDCVKINYIVENYKYYSALKFPMAYILPRPFSLKLVHQAKLTITNLFSNFGGLLSMYFGFNMIMLIEFVMKSLINIIIRKFSKTLIIIQKIIKILLLIIMMYQVSIIIRKYLKYNDKNLFHQ